MIKELRQYTCDRCKVQDVIETKDPAITSNLVTPFGYSWGGMGGEFARRPLGSTRDLCEPCRKIVCTALDDAFGEAMRVPSVQDIFDSGRRAEMRAELKS